MNGTRVGILIFILAVAAGPLYTVPGYSFTQNLISELAAQNTPRNWVMAVAILALGAGIVMDGARRVARQLVPFMAFGAFMGLAGLFGHKPIAADVPYVPWVHAAHSALATAAGFCITFAFIWQAVRQPSRRHRAVAGVLAVVCVAFPLAMLSFPAVQGAIQRTMYALVFVWLWVNYPGKTRA